ncbi:MAG: helix-turn-helix domain-containing protein [Acholeplasmataceae bacterium]|nr:helix-turn-helix domain-containing protein [Acholeplasmataceae bacterium]
MFDMRVIGRKISELRRKKNMTQLELADLLGISYQAVSNWERGDSMPDISKLSELSKIFEITIDELLGNTKETKAVQEIIETNKIKLSEHDSETIEAIMPMVKPTQLDESMKDEKNISMEMLLALAPFLDEDKIDEIALEAFHSGATEHLLGLAPFMSSEVLSKLVVKALDSNDLMDRSWYSGLIPFLDEEAVDSLGIKMYKKFGSAELHGLAPFMSEEALSKLTMDAIENNQEIDQELIKTLVPFLDEEAVDALGIKMYKKFGSAELHGLAPFMSEEALSKLAMDAIENNQVIDQELIKTLLPFLDEDVIDLLAIRLYKSSGVEQVIEFAPFMSEEAIEKIVDEEITSGNYQKIMGLLPFIGDGLSESILKSIRKSFKKD